MTRRLAAAMVLTLGSAGLVQAQTGQTAQTQETRIYTPGRDAGVTWPTPVRQVRPSYTEEGMRAKIQGIVKLEAVVLPDGSVGEVEVVQSLDRQYGLDDRAVAAAKMWRFEPAVLSATNQPVPVKVTIELEYRIHTDGEAGAAGTRALAQATQAPTVQSLEDFERGAYREGTPGVVAPKVLREVRPTYTSDALRAKLQGVARVDVVVNPDGSVARVRLAESIDPIYGLDQEALAAARRWTFEPGTGTLNGSPVPVITRLTLEFRIH